MMPEFSWWWITAMNNETKEEKTRNIKFTGPMPLAAELDYFCPWDVCTVMKMKLSHYDSSWVDDSVEFQDILHAQMMDRIAEMRKAL